MKLVKLSGPGWTKEFAQEADLKAELYKHICTMCRDGSTEVFESGVVWTEPACSADASLTDMLATSCGCEFTVED